MSKEPRKSTKIDEVQLQQQVEELTLALQRERADAENLRRRYDKQITELRNVIKVDTVKNLLPVVDNFDRALAHMPEDLEENDFITGIQGIVKQFQKTLKDLGVVRIETVGAKFDPELHEAVSMEEGEGNKEVVAEELQSGYMINGEVIRHAMVRVKTEK